MTDERQRCEAAEEGFACIRWAGHDGPHHGIEPAKLDSFVEDVLNLIGQSYAAQVAALAERVTELEVRQREADESAAERLEREG